MIQVNCFKCTREIEEAAALLISSPFAFFSDNVFKVDKFHLCKDCEKLVLDFMIGKIKDAQPLPKLYMLLESLSYDTRPNGIKIQYANSMIREIIEEIEKGVKA
jgi:hypothetical protein